MPKSKLINTVIIDRDGVINHDSEHYIKTPEEFILINYTIDALFKLYNNNIQIFIATNQSGINRNYYTLNNFFSINQKLLSAINNNKLITAIYYCPHTPEQICACRKPKSGMIDKIKLNHNINLKHTAFIGDSMRDITAATLAGCKYKFLVKTGNGERTFNKYKDDFTNNTNKVFDNLNSCVDWILS